MTKEKKKTIGLVLSGGGTRGYAHIGALKILEKEGIIFDQIAGTSSGAIVGALYAYYRDSTVLEHFVKNRNLYDVYDVKPSKKGIIKGDKIISKIREFLPAKNFGDLKTKLTINAVDMQTGKEKTFRKGDLLEAIRASISYPGVVYPKKINENVYIDGGAVNPLPFSIIPEADIYIMIDVSYYLEEINYNNLNLLQIGRQTINILQSQIIQNKLDKLKKPYVIIKPNLKKYGIFEFKFHPEIITMGEKAARSKLPEIKKMISEISE